LWLDGQQHQIVIADTGTGTALGRLQILLNFLLLLQLLQLLLLLLGNLGQVPADYWVHYGMLLALLPCL
jgi:hypothetical protein